MRFISKKKNQICGTSQKCGNYLITTLKIPIYVMWFIFLQEVTPPNHYLHLSLHLKQVYGDKTKENCTF